MIAFHLACDQDELEAAAQLLAIMDFILRRPLPEGRRERRTDAEQLVGGHERLWDLRHRDLIENATALVAWSHADPVSTRS